MLDTIFAKQKLLRMAIGRGKDIFESLEGNQKGEKVYHLLQALRQEVSEAQDELYWKWWAKEYKEGNAFGFKNEKNLKIEITDCFFFLLDICSLLGIDDKELFDLYNKKWAVNMKRQEEGYSQDKKTEQDNIEIQKEIK